MMTQRNNILILWLDLDWFAESCRACYTFIILCYCDSHHLATTLGLNWGPSALNM